MHGHPLRMLGRVCRTARCTAHVQHEAPHRVQNAGFTLIELMIAMALGLVIIYAAVAGVRTTSATITVANRLAIQNSLLRAGYFLAVENADFWQGYDDPDNAGAQRLRAYDAGIRRGCPFAPFATTIFAPSGTPGSEAERRWDAAYCWPANDTRTWFHGNLVEEVNHTGHVFGHYELFCHLKDNPNLARQLPLPGKNNVPSATVGVPFAGTVTATHTWYCNQLEHLKQAMGYYGAADYMPANAIYATMGFPAVYTHWGSPEPEEDQDLSHEWCWPCGDGGGSYGNFANDDGGTAWGRGIYRLTRDSTFPVVPASADTAYGTAALSDAQLCQLHAQSWATDRVGSAGDLSVTMSPSDFGDIGKPHGISDLTAKALIRSPLLTSQPVTWPRVTVSTLRYLSNSRFICLNRLQWRDPLTGEQAVLPFTMICTTLRGARQQRLPGGGWAGLAGANLDAPEGAP